MSHVTTMDESSSMSLVYVPQKTFPFCNQYHSICCSESGILWPVELEEGDSQKLEDFQDEGPTAFVGYDTANL